MWKENWTYMEEKHFAGGRVPFLCRQKDFSFVPQSKIRNLSFFKVCVFHTQSNSVILSTSCMQTEAPPPPQVSANRVASGDLWSADSRQELHEVWGANEAKRAKANKRKEIPPCVTGESTCTEDHYGHFVLNVITLSSESEMRIRENQLWH